MNKRLLLVCGALCAFVWSAVAAEPAAERPKLSQELKTLIEQIKVRIQAGARTEADLSTELRGFDALLGAHQGEKTDEVGEVLFMKGALYLQVLGEDEKGLAIMRQVKTDFAGTQPAKAAEAVLAQVEQQKESLRVQAELQPGAVFPNFEEKDLSGAPLSIAQFKGKVVLVDFWATWCGPCVEELPNVIAAYDKYRGKGFEVVGISLDRSEPALKRFLQEKGMKWPQYFDGQGWDSKLGRRYGITSIPATYLLDREGRILARDVRGPELERQLARLLGQ